MFHFNFAIKIYQHVSHSPHTYPFPSPLYPIHLTHSPLNTQSPKRNIFFPFLLFQTFSPAITSLNQSPLSPLNYPLIHSHSNITQIKISSIIISSHLYFIIQFIYLCSRVSYSWDVLCNVQFGVYIFSYSGAFRHLFYFGTCK